MYQWSADMVRYMRHASEFGDYNDRLADWMRPHLQTSDRVCDAGCGLGYLSLALAPYVQQITAVDRNDDALHVLRENCAAQGIGNIETRCGDLFHMTPATPYDAMVFCFFGRMEEITAIAKAQCRGTVFAFKKNYATHRFSVQQHPAGNDSFTVAKKWLNAHGVPFTAQETELELGQPFTSLDDARQFFEIYSRDTDKSLITDDFLREKLIETGDADFPLYMPHKRSVGCLRFEAADLP